MNVTLEDFTGSGHPDPSDYAATVLIFAKSTRLQMSPGLRQEIAGWPADKKRSELEYIANSIPAAWEFCDYTWLITDVPRSFTHQFVRTRTASFAQQTMRVLDVDKGPGWSYATGPTVASHPERQRAYDHVMSIIAMGYRQLVNGGAAIEDARGVLPTDILTNILVKMNLRNFVELVRKRKSARVQLQYREVLDKMVETVRAVHPWVDFFLDRTFDRAADDLQKMIVNDVAAAYRPAMLKLLDQMRAQS